MSEPSKKKQRTEENTVLDSWPNSVTSLLVKQEETMEWTKNQNRGEKFTRLQGCDCKKHPCNCIILNKLAPLSNILSQNTKEALVFLRNLLTLAVVSSHATSDNDYKRTHGSSSRTFIFYNTISTNTCCTQTTS